MRLSYDGTLRWDPPIIYKSFCQIEIKWFPFDRQNCSMKFGSWTYDGLNINLVHEHQKVFQGDIQVITEEDGLAVDFDNFRENTEWTVTAASAQRTVFKYSCCPTPYIDVTFYLAVTRKPLFIVVNCKFQLKKKHLFLEDFKFRFQYYFLVSSFHSCQFLFSTCRPKVVKKCHYQCQFLLH